MATKIIPSFKRMVAHLPFSSIVSKDPKKGTYIAHAKFNGDQYFGSGSSERQATLDLQHKLDVVALNNKVTSRG